MNFHRQWATDEALRRVRFGSRPGWPLSVGPYALAAGTRSAETNEDLAQSEGCQSGPQGNAQ